MNFKTIRIGRAIDNDIVIEHPSVSRHHLELFYDGEGNVFLTDLNSANGTFVNGQRIKGSVQLKPNDIVKAGLCEPLKWRNYSTASAQFEGKSADLILDESLHQNHFEDEQIPKKRNVPKIIIVTIISMLLLLGIFYVLNEYILVDSKSKEASPEKPMDSIPKVEKEKKITYDFSCLEDENDFGTTQIVGVFEEIDHEVTNTIGDEISVEQEMEVGDQLLADCQQEYTFIENGNKINNLRMILSSLTKKILDGKGFVYSIYLIQSEELNSFTAGAKIFVTSHLYDFCTSNDELACIIGHEIYHNELGHLRQYIQKEKLLSSAGAELSQILTIPFGQKKETHCDFKGIDLAFSAGYNGCVNISLWQRMNAEFDEGNYNVLDNLSRTHPYSEKRAICSKHHISQNYGSASCPSLQ